MYKGLKRLRSPFIFPEEGESKRNPLSLFRGKAMDTPQTKHRPCNHPPELNAPRTFEKRPRLRRGGVQGGPLLQDHSPKVSRTQQRPSTHRALMAHGRWVSSPLWSQEPPPPPTPTPGFDPHTSSLAIRPLPPSRSGRFSPPLLEGGGRETRIHQSCRTTHHLYPMGTRGGDRSAPIGAVQVRCPMPEAWLLPIGQSWLLFSNQLVPRAPLTRDRPFACVALVSKGNPPMNVSTEHILLAERSRGTTSGSWARLLRDQGKR